MSLKDWRPIGVQVAVIAPNQELFMKWIVADAEGSYLLGMQEIVNGLIERIELTPEIDLWINEESKVNDLPLNRTVMSPHGNLPIDIVCGVCFLAKHDGEGGVASITEQEAVAITRARLKGVRFSHLVQLGIEV